MVGDDGAGNQIGVAPGAKLIACKSFDDGGWGSDNEILTCRLEAPEYLTELFIASFITIKRFLL